MNTGSIIAQSLFDAVEIGLLIVGRDGRIESWNRWFTQAAGIESDRAAGRRLADVFPQLSGGRVIQAVDDALELGMSAIVSPRLLRVPFPLYAGEAERANGNPMRQMVVVRPFVENAVRRCLVQVTDVTVAVEREAQLRQARRDAEQANQQLRESQGQLETIIDTLPAIVFTKDLAGRHLMVNQRFEQTAGIGRGAAVGLTDRDLFPPEVAERFERSDRRVIAECAPFEYEEQVTHADGSTHDHLTIKVPLFDGQGEMYALIGMAMDITQMKKLQEELSRAKEAADAANQAKSVFLANMSHELRTPLNAILGFTQMMARDPDTTEGQRETVAIINRSGEHLLEMINDVLDLSKIEAGQVDVDEELVDLPSMMQDLERMFRLRAEGAGLAFQLEMQLDMGRYVRSDAGKLRQMLINLLGNAVKFTRRGAVTLRVRLVPREHEERDAWLELEVEDTGEGIPADEQLRVFKPFAQILRSHSRGQGTGLGLAITKSFVELLDGRIELESRPAAGSRFRIAIPVVLAHTPKCADKVTKRSVVVGLEAGQPQWRVLVVDDNRESRLLLRRLLTQVGFRVEEAQNGEEAVERFEHWRPHFIWMDIRMPILDGIQATRRIRALPSGDQVKISALTSSVFGLQRQQIIEAGCDDILHKPFQTADVFAFMARHLGLRYVHQEETPAAATGEGDAEGLDAVTPLRVPPALKAALKEAVRSLDIEQTRQRIQEIRELDPGIAHRLQCLVDRYQFSPILDILDMLDADDDQNGE